MKMILKLLMGIVGGLLMGYLATLVPDMGEYFIRLLITFKSIFGQFLSFVIPLLILFYIMSGIASLEQGSGKMLGTTVALAYGSTLVAGALAFLVASQVLPSFNISNQVIEKTGDLPVLFEFTVSPIMEVTSALLLAFIFGIGISLTKAQQLKTIIDQGKGVIEWVLAKVIIPVLPFYIATIFAEMTFDGTAFRTLSTFGLVLGLVIVMHWVWLCGLYIVTGLAHKKSPLFLIKTMLPAYLTAVGTMSSAATIPVALSSAKKMKVSEKVADFVMPLCATIHLSGSTITLVTCTCAVMLLTPDLALPTWGEMIPFLLLLGVTMVAAPGAPGGAVMAALGILATSFGFSEDSLALMIALYLAQDSFGTACNVAGDGVIALWVDKMFGEAETQSA